MFVRRACLVTHPHHWDAWHTNVNWIMIVLWIRLVSVLSVTILALELVVMVLIAVWSSIIRSVHVILVSQEIQEYFVIVLTPRYRNLAILVSQILAASIVNAV